MNKSCEIASALQSIPENELIFASKFYNDHLLDSVTEDLFYKTLERMCRSGSLCKISKGTYYRPKSGRYGIVPPSEQQIISTFTKDQTGTVIGYSLYNRLHLTTQVPKKIEVLSSQLKQQTKTIRNIHITQCNIEYSRETETIIHMLEVLKAFHTIEDINYSALIKFSKSFAETYNDTLATYILEHMQYQKRTISFLAALLSYYQVPNTLNQYLSTLSNYKHPSMEAIYAAAHLS